MARCAGLPVARWILLSGPEPIELSPGWSHSRPVRESQPSGFKRSRTYCVRHAARSFCQEVPCEAAGSGNSANKRAIKVRLAKRSLKRMSKYNLEAGNAENEDQEGKNTPVRQIIWRPRMRNWR